MKYILPKGFIAVDGISLTVGEVGDENFTVYLIPETLRITTLGVRAVGDLVNLEVEAQTQVCFLSQEMHGYPLVCISLWKWLQQIWLRVSYFHALYRPLLTQWRR
jgi:hypothetical protein